MKANVNLFRFSERPGATEEPVQAVRVPEMRGRTRTGSILPADPEHGRILMFHQRLHQI